MQNTISEHTTRRTLKQMSYSSRRPHRVPLLSAKNRKRRIQFTQAQQNWTIEDWKNVAWSDESWFLLRHSDGRVRIWCKRTWKHGSILPCLNGSGGGGVIVWRIFSWHTLGPLVPIQHRLHHSLPEYCCWCPSLYDYSVPIFWCTSSRIMHVSNHLRLVSWTWQWVHFTQMSSTVTRSQSNRAPLGCGGTGDSHHGCSDDKSAATAWCYHVNMDQTPSNTLLNLCHEELRQFWRQRGVLWSIF